MIEVSIVIPTYNRAASLQRVLAGLTLQTVPAATFEVIVVSDGSTDQTSEVLRVTQTPYTLVPITQPNLGPAHARNRGVAQARGALIVFLDDDVVPVPHWLAEHLRLHAAATGPLVVLGPMLPPDDFRLSPWVHWSQDRLAEQYQAMAQGRWKPTARQFYTGNASLPRALLETSQFDPDFWRAEDVELAYRLADRGVQFVFNAKAVGYHYEVRSFAAWLAMAHAYGHSDVAFTYQKGQTWLLPTVLREFRRRPRATQAVARLCLGHPRRRRWFTLLTRPMAWLGDRLNWSGVHRLACSSLFNLYHYQGIADGLGGRAQFFAALQAEPLVSAPVHTPNAPV